MSSTYSYNAQTYCSWDNDLPYSTTTTNSLRGDVMQLPRHIAEKSSNKETHHDLACYSARKQLK